MNPDDAKALAKAQKLIDSAWQEFAAGESIDSASEQTRFLRHAFYLGAASIVKAGTEICLGHVEETQGESLYGEEDLEEINACLVGIANELAAYKQKECVFDPSMAEALSTFTQTKGSA